MTAMRKMLTMTGMLLSGFFSGLLVSLPSPLTAQAAEPEPAVYELRTYVCEPARLADLQSQFRDHTVKLFARHGMQVIGCWTPLEGPAAETTLLVLLEHPSRAAATSAWQAVIHDPEWKQIASDLEKNQGRLLARPPESVFLTQTDYSPRIGLPVAGKVYELRTYTAPESRLPDLNTRFRDHTMELFRKHGIVNFGYWTPADPPRSENTLIYLLEYDSRESARTAFSAFLADPVWQAARDASQKNGPLTTKRPDSLFLKLTDFSPHQ